MSIIVIDAGVVLRRFVGGSNAAEATALVNYHLRQGDTLVAPRLIVYEIASVLHKEYVRFGTLTLADVARVLGDVVALLIFSDDPQLLVRGVEIAGLTKQRNAYDALCLALAERERAPFWTADKAFYDAAHPRFPPVRWIATFSMSAT